MTEPNLDKAVRKFKDYCQGNGGFDELDFKEYLIDVFIANQVREARSECLVVIDGLLELKERYGEVKDEADSEWNEALNTATAKIKELGE